MKNTNYPITELNLNIPYFFEQYYLKRMSFSKNPKFKFSSTLSMVTDVASVRNSVTIENEEIFLIEINNEYCQLLWGVCAYITFIESPKEDKNLNNIKCQCSDLIYKSLNRCIINEWNDFYQSITDSETLKIINLFYQLGVCHTIAHECSHIELGHLDTVVDPKKLKDEEYEADYNAYGYTMEAEGIDKQVWSVSICMVYITLMFIEGFEESICDSHPSAYKRLIKYCETMEADNDVWISCCNVLELYLFHCKINFSADLYKKSFQENFMYLVSLVK